MTIAVTLDKKRMTTTGENAGRYHIKVRLTMTREKKTIQRYFMTNIFATEIEFKKIMNNTGKDKELQEKQTKVFEIREKAKQIVKNNPFIDAETFGDLLTSKGSYKDPLGFLLAYAEELENEGRIGNRDFYKYAHSSWKKFADQFYNGHLSFAIVNEKCLHKYEKWMAGQGKSITTIGMYTTAMRTVFNLAASDKYREIPKELYPFGDGKYVIPTSKGRKLALDEVQKDKLLKYATVNIVARKGVDFWILSYFCNGMNMADVAHLRFKNLPDDLIVFDRVKTANSQRNKTPIVVIMREEVRRVIETWGNKEGGPNDYVFPILRDGLTPQQIKDRIHDFTQEINEGLEIACEKLEIPRITTYSARHTFATIAKNKGATTEFIQEALGHSDSKTTKAYLDSFDIETKKRISNLL